MSPPIERLVTPTPTLLQVDALYFSHPQRILFNNWSASIPPGVTFIGGGDGSGKTTLLRLLAGELSAAQGQLQIGDVRLDDDPIAYRQQIFWTDPRSEVLDQISVVDYFKSLHLRYPQWDDKVLAELINGLALGPHLDKFIYMLSTGSKRKVWMAAAFASGAKVTLLDEPFAALDHASIRFVTQRLADAAQDRARALIMADYVAPTNVSCIMTIDLGD
ncbi:ABC transporter ATP-binding protein [Glaciimonas sp. GG7]